MKNFARILLLFPILFFSLSKTALAQAPTISTFSPVTASPGSTVTITGTGFSSTPSNNIVYFGPVRAAVTSIDLSNPAAQTVAVTVPVGAGYAPIVLLNSGTRLSAYSAAYFKPTYSPTNPLFTIPSNFEDEQVSFPGGGGVLAVRVADIDGDGKNDVITVSADDNLISVQRYAGRVGHLSFSSRTFTTDQTPVSIATGDLNGDGKLDIVACARGAVSVLINTSTPGSPASFLPLISLPLTGFVGNFSVTRTISITDLDGDGKPDIVFTMINAGNVGYFRNTSSGGTFSSGPVQTITTGNSAAHVTDDFDGDGRVDIVASGLNNSNITCYRNTSTPGNISFSSSVQALVPGAYLATADFNGDGKLDLGLTNSGNFYLLRNQSTVGNISFASTGIATAMANLYPSSLSLGDVNGDEKPDIVVGTALGNDLSVYLNTTPVSSTNFSVGARQTKGTVAVWSTAIGDIDGDGKPDMLSVDPYQASLSVFRNNPGLVPVIADFNPKRGPTGTQVVITGTDFVYAETDGVHSGGVSFGGVAANVTANPALTTVTSSTSLTSIVGAGETGDVVLTTPYGAASLGTFQFLNSDANLIALTATDNANNNLVISGFTSNQNNYVIAVPNNVTSLKLSPTASTPQVVLPLTLPQHTKATIKLNGQSIASGSSSASLPLLVGTGINVFTFLVTAEDGVTTKTYTVTVNRAASSDANLSGLSISSGPLTPVFASSTLAYTAAQVANNVTSVTVTASVTDATASIKINNVSVASGAASNPIALTVGQNIITTVVTAQDGSSVKTYTITLTRLPSSNANLSNLAISEGTLTPVFLSSRTSYTASVTNDITSVKVTPTFADATSTIKVNGFRVARGTASGDFALAVGPNTINVLVTAEDGVTVITYSIIITRAANSNANLSGLVISTGTLNPVFDPQVTGYTAAVPNFIKQITVTPTFANNTAVITVNGVVVASGAQSQAIALNLGLNTIETKVVAQDGTTKIYTISLTRIPSSTADLISLSISQGILSPAFSSGSFSYTTSVNGRTASMFVIPTVSDPTATITVNGSAVSSATQSQPIALVVGNNNLITIRVTAEDGITYKEYYITVDRIPSNDATLFNLVVGSGQIKPGFGPEILNYSVNVQNSISSTVITPTASDPFATIRVQGVLVNSGNASANIALAVPQTTIAVLVTAQDGITKRTYVITVTREPSSEAGAANIRLSNGTLTPAFSSAITSYIANVANNITSVKLTPTAADPTATIKVNGFTVASGVASGDIPLIIGDNLITTVFTAQDGVTKQTYTIVVKRAFASDASLINLFLSNGTLSPSFSRDGILYTSVIDFAYPSISVTPTAADATSTILVSINGSAPVKVNSASATAQLPLNIGTNTIQIQVIAQDGVTTRTYTVQASRIPAVNQAPTMDVIADQLKCYSFGVQSIPLTGISPGGPTEASQTVSLSVNSSNPTLFSQLSISGSGSVGTINFIPANGLGGTAIISVTVRDNGGTSNGGADTFTLTFRLTINPEMIVSIVSNGGTEISKGQTVNLTANGGKTYVWDDASGILIGQNSATLTVRPSATTTYRVTATNASGCVSSQKITITVRDDYKTLVSNNVITPNGDGKNDYLVVKNIDLYPVNRLRIFDRAGREIYTKLNYTNDWDCTVGGIPLKEDTYYYTIDFPSNELIKGNFTIIRKNR